MKYDIGFLGGGQLARMSIQAAQRMGLRCVSLDPSDQTPASKIADSVQGALNDPESIEKIFRIAGQVTLENEFIPAVTIEQAMDRGGHAYDRLIPGWKSLAIVQDKLFQRRALIQSGVPSPQAVPLEGEGEEALETLGLPLVLKTRFGGYDGKGTRYARNPEEWEALKPLWQEGGWLAEQFVLFKRELAVMVVATEGNQCCFPTVETVQTKSVCDLVYPCSADATQIAQAAVEAVGGRGLFGVELFELEDGSILVNELAPRPHNSGHYTLDWGGPSQFDYHVRAVLGLPFDVPESSDFAVMANLLGQPGAGAYLPALSAALEIPGSKVHWYEKDDPKPGRKMGHINVVGRDSRELGATIEAAIESRRRFYDAWTATEPR